MKRRKDKFSAIYIRVSTGQQSHRSQIPDLKTYIQAHRKELGHIRIFRETATGQNMNRKKWNKLYKSIQSNLVTHLICWRLDRLGRTCSGLTKLFEELQKHHCNLISVKDSIDLGTTAGRLIANVLASVAAYENEVRTERIIAGQAAAKAAGKSIGGSRKGSLYKVTMEQVRQIDQMKAKGFGVTEIARTVNTSTVNVYRVLERVRDGDIKLD